MVRHTAFELPQAVRRLRRCWTEGGRRRPDTRGGTAPRGATHEGLIRAGAPLLARDGGLVWLGPEAARVSPGSPRLFLGTDKAGTPVFALDLPPKFELEGSLIEGVGEFADFRQGAARMPAMDANCASTARSLFLWHGSHGYCA